MDPFWALAAELWWVAPIAVGGGAATVVAVRKKVSVSGRRLGYDAARWELRTARREAREAADAARVARAEASRAQAERAATGGDGAAVAAARRALRDAQREARAATARVKASRVRVSTERSALSSGPLPLDRVRARHDAVLARWMAYETDAERAIAYPAMSDSRQPATAAFFAAVEVARDGRPSDGRVTPEEFSAYRRAVDDLERAFDIAERSAKGEKHQELPDALWDAARTLMERTTDALGAWGRRRDK